MFAAVVGDCVEVTEHPGEPPAKSVTVIFTTSPPGTFKKVFTLFGLVIVWVPLEAVKVYTKGPIPDPFATVTVKVHLAYSQMLNFDKLVD